MSSTVTYKGSTIATVDNQTKTLLTQGKYLEGNIIITDVALTFSTIHTGSSAPSSSLGVNGDIYLQV